MPILLACLSLYVRRMWKSNSSNLWDGITTLDFSSSRRTTSSVDVSCIRGISWLATIWSFTSMHNFPVSFLSCTCPCSSGNVLISSVMIEQRVALNISRL